ncbi:hypothetical protein J31TS4_35700 [Paenibacillus sp. J31TS4]|uniref:gluconate 2-dehydrogenase subunit 3 family protein n=1 Tax=Paenibacillus sp. J31TS4 TaxID=2807195 RepID=UPI001B2AD170|nr:gluconate 2-dehydrogenase subunit 3 family protein [Paenibacillus sp. J31TS4]GIP40290.1 hypothetical protein J31TS4_35700 [Paenibacillus sp. J31TS4]
MQKQTIYPDYNVMNSKDEWDVHTRQIVENRLVPVEDYSYFGWPEIETLRAVCSLLVDDSRTEIIAEVLRHFDSKMTEAKGEGQRKAGVPKEALLVRKGLQALDQSAMDRFQLPFHQLTEAGRRQLLTELAEGRLPAQGLWTAVPQKELFQKLLMLTLESYYSHPAVWSEIGYGGPAYPRGYVRADIGHLDPWEAKQQP